MGYRRSSEKRARKRGGVGDGGRRDVVVAMFGESVTKHAPGVYISDEPKLSMTPCPDINHHSIFIC